MKLWIWAFFFSSRKWKYTYNYINIIENCYEQIAEAMSYWISSFWENLKQVILRVIQTNNNKNDSNIHELCMLLEKEPSFLTMKDCPRILLSTVVQPLCLKSGSNPFIGALQLFRILRLHFFWKDGVPIIPTGLPKFWIFPSIKPLSQIPDMGLWIDYLTLYTKIVSSFTLNHFKRIPSAPYE